MGHVHGPVDVEGDEVVCLACGAREVLPSDTVEMTPPAVLAAAEGDPVWFDSLGD